MAVPVARLLLVPFILLLISAPARSDALDALERVLALRFRVAQITPQRLAKIPQTTPPLIFDVRSPDEFAVSHLAGAIRIEPTRGGEDFLRQFSTELRGRTAVFYCTVGARSSRLALDVLAHLTPGDRVTVYNLRGGIFRWQAAGLPLRTMMVRPIGCIHTTQSGRIWHHAPVDSAIVLLAPAHLHRRSWVRRVARCNG